MTIVDNQTSNVTSGQLPESERRSIGVTFLILTVWFIAFNLYIVWIIVGARLWQKLPFFLWFLSLSLIELGHLLVKLFGCLVIICQDTLIPYPYSLIVGHLYCFCYTNSVFHMPVIALLRFFSVFFPSVSKWFVNRLTAARMQIVILWTSSLIATVLLQIQEANWTYFSPTSMGWESVCPSCYTRAQYLYWTGMPMFCVSLMVFLYALCVLKLHYMRRRIGDGNSSNHTTSVIVRRGERNMIKIGATLGVGHVMVSLFWRINTDYLSGKGWWSTCSLTLVELLIAGSHAIILLFTSNDIRSRSSAKCHGAFARLRSLLSGNRETRLDQVELS